MESLVFNGSLTSDRQCVNITILNDDLREALIFTPQPEVFQVLLNASNNTAQLDVQTALIFIEDDDCMLSGTLILEDVGLHTLNNTSP